MIIMAAGVLLFLSGCLYDNAPSQPASQIDTWLIGDWLAQDKKGKIYEAIITPQSSTLYHVSFYDKDKKNDVWEFEGWLSRVDHLKFLTLRSLSENRRYHNKYLFLHYELIRREKVPHDGVGPCRILITEPHLDASAQILDSYELRKAIRKSLHQGTLLLPQGSVIWTRVGDQCWPESARKVFE